MKIISWVAVVLATIVLMSLTFKESFTDSKPASLFTVSVALKSQVAISGIAGFSKKGHPIEAFYFPGTSNKRAMVIGGVHGSELSAIEVAKKLLHQLSNDRGNYYSVIVVPCLFPDNAQQAQSNSDAIGSVYNIGRYSYNEAADPNRQMPALGTPFDSNHPIDKAGRIIEPENQLLLKLMQEFRPERIVNLHAIRIAEHAGIYADPRTTSAGAALEYVSDSALTINMAVHIHNNGGIVPGNQLNKKPTSLYYCDPPVAQPGRIQARNLLGSKLPCNRGYGVSLGSWASTAIDDEKYGADRRDAICLLTMEFPGYKRPADYPTSDLQDYYQKLVDVYAQSIKDIFLKGSNKN